MEDRCLFCNEIVPEGRIICPQCEWKINHEYNISQKELKTDSNISKVIFIICFAIVIITIFFVGGN